jgi:hypothetical protein
MSSRVRVDWDPDPAPLAHFTQIILNRVTHPKGGFLLGHYN